MGAAADYDVVIVGAGPGGLAAANALLIGDSSLRIKVFERASSLRPAGFVVGILPNALKAIRAIDEQLGRELEMALRPSDSAANVAIFSNTGEPLMQVDGRAARARYDRYGGGLFPVAWYDLQSFFAARLPPGVLETASALERYEPGGADAPVTVHLQDGRSVTASVLVGADGNLSRVRGQLLGDGLPRFAGLAVWRAMRQRPAGWPVDAGLLNYADAGEARKVMTYALPDGRLTWNVAVAWPEAEVGRLGNLRYITAGHEEGTPQQKLDRCLGALAESEGGWPAHVLELLRSTELGAITEHPLFFREPGDCEVYGAGRVTLLGDAAHLTAAALGQGTSQTMEDALELGRQVARAGPTESALRAYEAVSGRAAARRAPAAGAVQKASADLVRNWGRLAEKWVLAEQRASEQFFSREFAPLVPRTLTRTLPGPGEAAPSGPPPRAPALRACLGRGAARPARRARGAARRAGPRLGPRGAGPPATLHARLL